MHEVSHHRVCDSLPEHCDLHTFAAADGQPKAVHKTARRKPLRKRSSTSSLHSLSSRSSFERALNDSSTPSPASSTPSLSEHPPFDVFNVLASTQAAKPLPREPSLSASWPRPSKEEALLEKQALRLTVAPPAECCDHADDHSLFAAWGACLRAADHFSHVERIKTFLYGQQAALLGAETCTQNVAACWALFAPQIGARLRGGLPDQVGDIDNALDASRHDAITYCEQVGFRLLALLERGQDGSASTLLLGLAGGGPAVQAGVARCVQDIAMRPLLDSAFVGLMQRLSQTATAEQPGPWPAAVMALQSAMTEVWLSRAGSELTDDRLASAWAVLTAEADTFARHAPAATAQRHAAYLSEYSGLLHFAGHPLGTGWGEACAGERDPNVLLVQAAAAALACAHYEDEAVALVQNLHQLASLLALLIIEDVSRRALPAQADQAVRMDMLALLTQSLWQSLNHCAQPKSTVDVNDFAALCVQPALAAGSSNAIAQVVMQWLVLPVAPAEAGHDSDTDDQRSLECPSWCYDDEPWLPTPPGQAAEEPRPYWQPYAPWLDALCGGVTTPAESVERATLLTRLIAGHHRHWPTDFASALCKRVVQMLASVGLDVPSLWRQTLLGSTSRRHSLLACARGASVTPEPRAPAGWKFCGLEEGHVLDSLQTVSRSDASAHAPLGRSQVAAGLKAKDQAWQNGLKHDAYQAAWQSLFKLAGHIRIGANAAGVWTSNARTQKTDARVEDAKKAWERVDAACCLFAEDQPLPLPALHLLALSPLARIAARALVWRHLGLLRAWIAAVRTSGMQHYVRHGREYREEHIDWSELISLRAWERLLESNAPQLDQ